MVNRRNLAAEQQSDTGRILDPADRAERLEIYKLLVEMADRVSQRRQAANSFYLSINTVLVGGSAYLASSTRESIPNVLVSVAGILSCVYWNRSILSYKTLNTAKFDVINDLESSFATQAFTSEWKKLSEGGDGKKHKSFYETEKLVPKIFMGMYGIQILLVAPWKGIFGDLISLICFWSA